ncbi:PREDICTED: uncharacterized protein LOC109476630 [Branchiostoma belcheri]|uniref:Uncharacterized protein LOC109476630 n=1 Tax=Branchiostoma belcheri TaxID=7741 RepID=A0A6P4Z941_BRABE|nr:PREDICTED: uncharacterized protein LOC109476630 [Branchiostoma belcheri]
MNLKIPSLLALLSFLFDLVKAWLHKEEPPDVTSNHKTNTATVTVPVDQDALIYNVQRQDEEVLGDSSDEVNEEEQLDGYHQPEWLHLTYRDKNTNKEVYRRIGTKPISSIITESRMKYAGHVLRMTADSLAKTFLHWKPEGRRKRGRPKLTWPSTFQKDLEHRGVLLADAENLDSSSPTGHLNRCRQELGIFISCGVDSFLDSYFYSIFSNNISDLFMKMFTSPIAFVSNHMICSV